MGDKPRLVVACDRSSVSFAELVTGLGGLADIVFLLNSSPFTERLPETMTRVGTVVDMASDMTETARRLKALSPDGILTFSERMLVDTAELAAALGLPFHTPETAAGLTDKFRQRTLLREAGVDSVRSMLVTVPEQWPAAVATTGLPAVVKPVRGEGSRSTHLVEDEETGMRVIRHALTPRVEGGAGERAMVVEEYLRGRDCGPFGDYISVESVVSHDEISHFAVTGKYPQLSRFREQAQFWPPPPGVEQAEACTLAERAARALGVRTGLLHTEFKLTAGGPRLIEVNGRMGGLQNELALRAEGLELVGIAGRLALGERITVDTVRPSRVFYQMWHNAPTWDCVLEEVRGIRQLRTLPTVVGYRRMIHPGDQIDGSLGTNFLGLVLGEAANHDEMLAAVDQVHDALEFVFSGPEGTFTLSGRDLAREGR